MRFYTTLVSTCLVILFSSTLMAYTEIPPCYAFLMRNFYNPTYVLQGLSLHYDIPQSSWSLINNDLQKRVPDIAKIVQTRAKILRPNPFQHPIDKKKAEEILDEALFQVLSEVMSNYKVVARYQVIELYQFIKYNNQAYWNHCFLEK